MRKFKRLAALFLVAVLVVCAVPTNVQAATKTKKKIESVSITNVDAKSLVLKKGTKFKLKTKVIVKGGASKKLTYSTSNKKIATIDKNGQIKAIKNGKATIYVKSVLDKKKSAKLNVIVGTPVTKITLSSKSITLTKGKSKTLKVTLNPSKPSIKAVTFTSKNKKIATVSNKGVIKAVKKGSTTITVKATDGSKKYATCKVTVKDATKPAPVKPVDPKPETPAPVDPKPETPVEDIAGKYLKEGFSLKWNDEFDGQTLNRNDWNVELHEPGWVNSELQQYVDSTDNIYVKDGKLVIQPIKTIDENGKITYTSGRVNTQNKHDFKYGRFEAKVKVPSGKGFLPAFWMMPTVESTYGQWPRCGEIDIMEVLGHETTTCFGTIHFGNPHSESQGKYTLSNNNFSDDYHVYTCDWEPGKIIWYVDGIKFHEANDWYSTTVNKGTVTYPAPFDQPFYMILNLAVGGNWPGNPDDSADYINTQNLSVDYVRVYQKDSYNENVTKPEQELAIRVPDATGNYVHNSDFVTTEDLGDEADWIFMAQNGGVGSAEINNNEIIISTVDAGSESYSIQLVQPGIPVEKGATYKFSFDAYADADRTMIVDVSAPFRGWGRYFSDTTVSLSTEKQHYEFEYSMTDTTDDRARVEFNLGRTDAIATTHITNVRIEKIDQKEIVDEKTILADGNCIYNGEFQEGPAHLGEWNITNSNNSAVEVTSLADGRRFKVDSTNASAGDVTLSQSDLAVKASKKYVFKFDAASTINGKILSIDVAGVHYDVELTTENNSYTYRFETADELTSTDIIFNFGNNGITYLDNVRLAEDALIANGDFSADLAGFDVYVDGSANASYVVDSQKEDNAVDITIAKSGDANWKIQLKQNDVTLEKGKWYSLSFDIKSSIARTIEYAIQRDGATHRDENNNEDWTPYVQQTVALSAYDTIAPEYTHVTTTFQMLLDTDKQSIFNIALGAGGVNGSDITEQHRICIDNIVLAETAEPGTVIPSGVNLLQNTEFSTSESGELTAWENAVTAPATATADYADGKFTYNVTNVGEADWNIQLKQMGLTLEKNCNYTLKCTLVSDVDRLVKLAVMTPSAGYAWHGGADVELKAGVAQDITVDFTSKPDVFTDDIVRDTGAGFFFSVGNCGAELGPHSVSISNISLVKNN